MKLLMPVLLAGLIAGDGMARDDPVRPADHFRVEQPAILDDGEALAIYEQALPSMLAAYALADNPIAGRYSRWRRYNSAPYRSDTHGARYVNNYANTIAADYGHPPGGKMRVGSILVKDAFTVTESGAVFPGPLAIMEKMPRGFDPAARDWKYSSILPDGSLIGESAGFNAEGVGFCSTCHAAAGEGQDHLFFVPEAYRMDDPD